MPETKRKTQAEKAADAKGKKGKAASGKKPQEPVQADKSTKVPPRVLSSILFLSLFVLLVVILIKPEGKLLVLLSNFIYGVLGRICFVVCIPVTLYLFCIHAFSGKRPVCMRTVSLLLFAFGCGCLGHIASDPQIASVGLSLIGELFRTGIDFTSGGVICGGFAMLLNYLCGSVLSMILFAVLIAISLLGGMGFTVSSVIRAIENRPKLDWEEEEKKNRPEPATVVVNKIVTKQNQRKERRRIRQEQQLMIPEVTEPEKAKVPSEDKPASGKKSTKDIFRQIEGDPDTPVAVAGHAPVQAEATMEAEEELIVPSPEPEIYEPEPIEPMEPEEQIPENMPPFEGNEPLAPPAPPKKQPVKKVKVSPKEPPEKKPEPKPEPPTGQPGGEEKPAYCFPPIDLLDVPDEEETDGTAEMKENSRRLNETLASFKIEAHIVNVTRGPSVTRYDVELAKGVRLGKLTSAADDIALSLGAVGVRIAAVPGKISVVGIEVPNRDVTKVFLREVIDSVEFAKARSKASFAVGKDISGSCIIGNIAKMPHMLIAGTTGSGKSVCTNSIIISLLYKASPDDVKLIMVDPKMVELGIYNGIPHLLIPVVTDPKKAAGALQWAVTEMMRRYKAMSDEGVRDLESYNSIMESQDTGSAKMPQIVVIIDELADLMMVAAKEVEESICRIAQMGRAAGIHLIIATQRPSSDVITGTMKANIPSRIAFAVASALESRIILDTTGAEKLVGKGDMLYAPMGTGKPRRVQGCFVTDNEVEEVTNYVKNNFTSAYDSKIMDEIDKKAEQTGNKAAAEPEPKASAAELQWDELFPDAVDVVLETGQASASMLQRRLKLGYARAARIIDEMEENHIVGPFAGGKPRTLLISKEQWKVMRSEMFGGQMEFDDYAEQEEYPDEDDSFIN